MCPVVQPNARFGELLHLITDENLTARYSLDNYPEISVAAQGRLAYTDEGRRRCNEWLNAIKRKIEVALERQAKIVVLPEFGLPLDCEQIVTPVRSELEKIRSKFDALVFSGSRHDGPHNRGLVIWPAREARSKWHYKLVSARRLGENILGSAQQYMNIYPIMTGDSVEGSRGNGVRGFAVRIGICYDVYDPTIFTALLSGSNFKSKEPFPILLVPSFNRSSAFVALLRDISFLSQSIVVYVDALHGEARMFICGVALRDFIEPERFQRMLESIEEAKNILGEAIDEHSLTKRSMQRKLVKIEERLKQENISGEKKISGLERHQTKIRRAELRYKLARAETENAQREVRLSALKNLGDNLQALMANDITKELLRLLVTCEPCKQCAANTKYDDTLGHLISCNNDILYFNIPYPLISALDSFRKDYFSQSSHDVIPPEFIPFLSPSREPQVDALPLNDAAIAQ